MQRPSGFNICMFAFFFLCVIAVGGCHSKDSAQPQPPMGNEVRSSIPRDTNPQVSDADLAAVVGSNTDFALKAFGQINTDPDTNAVFSPYSITLAVALAAAGARGTTLSGMEQAFTFSTTADLNVILTDLGAADAFDELKADFSGIDGGRDLHINAILHQAFIVVDEKGTEAAAATAVIGSGVTSAPPTPNILLTIDHPFLFLLRDRQTGLILFMGKVVSL